MEQKDRGSLRESRQLLVRVFFLINHYAPGLWLSMTACAVLSAVTPYVTVFFSARVLEELAGARRPEQLWRWVIAAVTVTGALALVTAAARRWRDGRVSVREVNHQRIYTDKMLDLDFADLEKQETCDQLSQIRQNEGWTSLGIYKIPALFEELLQHAAGIISAIVLVAGLFSSRVPAKGDAFDVLDGPAGFLILLAAVVLPSALGSWLWGRALEQKQGAAMADQARLGNRMFSVFGYWCFESSRALDIRMYEQQTITHRCMEDCRVFSADGPLAKINVGMGGLMEAMSAGLSALTTGAVYLYVCLKAWAGAFGVGAAAQYIGAVTALTGNVRDFLSAVSELRHCMPYLRSAFAFLDLPNGIYRGTLTTEKRADREYDVEFRDVSFRYPGSENWALRHVSVKFRVGERLAVVGENGSGKTTFIKLLCRLYDPQEGLILLNGIDIRKYNYRDYMDVFSVVFQDFQLFSNPLGDNVAGAADYDRARVLQSLADAGFGERLASLPEGLNTQLYREFEDGGVLLSGGEAQKVAIARALYKDAPFIILDEPTAALDPIAEAEIYAQFNEISGDKTAIYISHRLSSCRFCDEILVFDGGQIVQRGTHDNLLSAPAGKYHELWTAQAQYYTTQPDIRNPL